MKTTTPLPSSREIPTTRRDTVLGIQLEANPWNPNRMTAAMYAKILESIQEYGMVDPLTVREIDNTRYQIIDGENRWRGATDLGYTEFDVTVIEGMTDAQARKLTIIMNELHGQADPDKMGDLLADILSLSSLEELMIAMPYDEAVLAGYLQTPLPQLPPLKPLPGKPPTSESKEPWAERLFKMPKTVALIVDEALEKAKDGEELEAWQALERVAADYLAS